MVFCFDETVNGFSGFGGAVTFAFDLNLRFLFDLLFPLLVDIMMMPNQLIHLIQMPNQLIHLIQMLNQLIHLIQMIIKLKKEVLIMVPEMLLLMLIVVFLAIYSSNFDIPIFHDLILFVMTIFYLDSI